MGLTLDPDREGETGALGGCVEKVDLMKCRRVNVTKLNCVKRRPCLCHREIISGLNYVSLKAQIELLWFDAGFLLHPWGEAQTLH